MSYPAAGPADGGRSLTLLRRLFAASAPAAVMPTPLRLFPPANVMGGRFKHVWTWSHNTPKQV